VCLAAGWAGMTPDALRELAIAAARSGGAVLRRYYGAPGRVTAKPGGAGPVSEADLASEAVILNVLRWSQIPVLAEESGGKDNGSDRRWIVDPLDGTSNFIRHLPWFCVGIALAEGDDVELGVVFAPLTEELFVAERGKGTMLNHAPVRVSATPSLKESCLFSACDAGVCSVPARIERFARVASRARELRSPNAALLDLAYVAAGRADGFWEQGIAPWDIAAGSLLVREAGGETSDFRGGPLKFARGEIAGTNGRIHRELVAVLSG
jgi:myo-inositol-1(or 4)-monophosphatase